MLVLLVPRQELYEKRKVHLYQHPTSLIIPTGFHFDLFLLLEFGASWPVRLAKTPAVFWCKMRFKGCRKMVMCSATCQSTSMLRPMGKAVVKNQAFWGGDSQSNLAH